MLEDSLCRCGHSAFLAHGPAGVGQYEETTETCHACGAISTKERDRSTIASVRDRHEIPATDDEMMWFPDDAPADVRYQSVGDDL